MSFRSQVVFEASPAQWHTEERRLAHKFILHVFTAYLGSRHNPKDFSAEGWVSACLVTRLLSLTLLGVRRTHFFLPR